MDNIIILNDSLSFIYIMREDSFIITDTIEENNKPNYKYIFKKFNLQVTKEIQEYVSSILENLVTIRIQSCKALPVTY